VVGGVAVGLALARPKLAARWARPAAALLVGASPLLLPLVDELARRFAALSGLVIGGVLIAALVAGGLANLIGSRVGPRRALRPAEAIAIAIGLLPALSYAVPSVGLISCGLLGGALLLPKAIAAPGPDVVREDRDRAAAPVQFASGLALTAVAPLALLTAAPLLGPSPGWFAEAGVGLALGAALAAAAARRPKLAGAVAGLAPLACLGGAELLLRAPGAVGQAISAGVPAVLGGAPVAGAVVTAAAMALIGLAVRPGGVGFAWGAAAGAALWIAVPTLVVEPALIVRLAVGAVGLATLPTLLSADSAVLRGAAAVAASAALGVLALPAPPGALRALSPYEAFASPGDFSELVRVAGWRRGAARLHPGGSAATSPELQPEAIWSPGAGRRLDDGLGGSDLFLAHLPALVTGDPPASVLVLGPGAGGVVDGARRSSAGPVTVSVGSPGQRWLLQEHGRWNRDVIADPAVRLSSVDPLASGQRWSAILVDLPPSWVPGGPAERSPRRLRAIAAHLDPGGVAVLRIPLHGSSADELAALTADVADSFPGLTAWLDPTGAAHLLLVGRPEEGAVDAGALFRSWSRRAVAQDLQRASLASPGDALERLVTDRTALLAMASGRSRRGRFGTAVVAGARVRTGEPALALATLAAAGSDLQRLLDLSGVPEDEIEPLRLRLSQASAIREDYLTMLEAIEQDDSATALQASQAIAERGGTGASRDLKSFIAPWVLRCRALREQGLIDQARGECLIAHSFSPTDDEVALLLADLHRALDQLPEAEELYRGVRERDPTSLGAALGLASVHELRNEVREALELLEEAEKLHPGNALLLHNLGALHLRWAKSRTNDEAAAPHVERARGLFVAAATLEPRFASPRAGLSEVYTFEQQYDLALVEIERAVSMAPTCRLRAQRAQALFDVGRSQEANRATDEVLLECPDELGALLLKGILLDERGCYQQAYEQWGRALQVAPDLQAAITNRAWMQESGLLDRGDQDCRPD